MKRAISAMLGISIAATMAVGLTGCNGGGSSNTLTWICLGEKPEAYDAVMEKVNEIVEPETGLKLEIQYIDSASFTEKTKLKMASKDPYDLVYTGYVNSYQTAVQMGGLYDITELMENIQMKDGTTVKMSDIVDDYYLETATIDGRIYGIPNAQVISNPSCYIMSKSVCEECGVDMARIQELAQNNTNAETAQKLADAITEEWAKIKEKRPDLYTTTPSVPTGANIWETILGGVALRRDGSSSELVIYDLQPESEIGTDTIRKWYELGYIRSDIASAGEPTSDEEKKQYAVINNTWKPGQDLYWVNKYGEEPVNALTAVPYVSRTSALLTMISVGANSKHPEEAVKLIYMLNSNKELYNLICWGIEGVNYTLNEDGTAKEIKGTGYDNVASNAWRYGNQFNSYVMEGNEPTVWEETQKMNDEAVKSPALGFVPDTTSIDTEIANISNVESEYKARKGYGTSPRSEYWDEYISKLKTAGIEKVRDELQKQYDEFLASKN